MAGEFSWNSSSSINIHLQHEKERLRRETTSAFSLENSQKFHLKRGILPTDDHNQGIFSPNQGTFFQFYKRTWQTSLLPSLVTLLVCTRHVTKRYERLGDYPELNFCMLNQVISICVKNICLLLLNALVLHRQSSLVDALCGNILLKLSSHHFQMSFIKGQS